MTIAMAVDHNTAGERCTRKAVDSTRGRDALFAITPRERDKLAISRLLYAKVRNKGARVLNIAGNGIYTLSKEGITQQAINQYVYDILRPVVAHWEFDCFVSGGQTGVDMAGAVAAAALGLPATLTFPLGYKQRFEDGVDVCMTPDQIYKQIEDGVAALKHARHAPVGVFVRTNFSGSETTHKVVERLQMQSQSGVGFRVTPAVPKSGGEGAWIDSDWFEVVDV